MAYRSRQYDKAGTEINPVAYASTDVMIDAIPVRNGDINRPISVFIKGNAGPNVSFKLQESVDGEAWEDIGPAPAIYAGDWTSITLKEATFPSGVLVRVVATSGIVVAKALVVQAW